MSYPNFCSIECCSVIIMSQVGAVCQCLHVASIDGCQLVAADRVISGLFNESFNMAGCADFMPVSTTSHWLFRNQCGTLLYWLHHKNVIGAVSAMKWYSLIFALSSFIEECKALPICIALKGPGLTYIVKGTSFCVNVHRKGGVFM